MLCLFHSSAFRWTKLRWTDSFLHIFCLQTWCMFKNRTSPTNKKVFFLNFLLLVEMIETKWVAIHHIELLKRKMILEEGKKSMSGFYWRKFETEIRLHNIRSFITLILTITFWHMNPNDNPINKHSMSSSATVHAEVINKFNLNRNYLHSFRVFKAN